MKSLQNATEKLNQVCEKNLGKALFGFFFMAIMESITITLVLLPVFSLYASEDTFSIPERAVTGLLLFCALEIWFLFQYGFISMLLRFVQNKFVTMGFIFMGFKTLKKSLRPTLFASFLCALTVVVFQAASFVFRENLKGVIEQTGFQSFALGAAGVIVLICALLLLNYAFLFPVSFENESSSLADSLRKNRALLKGNRFALVRLMLSAGGRSLSIAAVAFALETVLAGGGENTPKILSVVSLFLSFIYFVNLYTAFMRMYFAIPVLYDSCAHIDVTVEDAEDENRLVLEETVALLSDEKTEVKTDTGADIAAETDAAAPLSGEEDGSSLN